MLPINELVESFVGVFFLFWGGDAAAGGAAAVMLRGVREKGLS